MTDKKENIVIKHLTAEQNVEVLDIIREQIEKRKLLWCCDTEQFIEGLLIGLEIGIVEINKYTIDTNKSEEEE